MAAIVLYGYDGDHVERDNSVESNPDHYESVEKKARLDRYEMGYFDTNRRDGEFEDVSLQDNPYCEYGPVEEMKMIKIETKKRVEVLSASIKDEDTGGALFDTTDACILELDPEKLKPTNGKQLLALASLLTYCRRRMTIYTFTHPGKDGRKLDGGGIRVYESSGLSDQELERYSTTVRKVIQQYNDIVANKYSNSKLEFVSFTRSACKFRNKLFITFKARQVGNGQIGTYQAAVADKFSVYEVQLVLLRHVEADKILAILSLSGAPEEVKKKFGGNWD